jgi:hypothetical protein
MQKSLLHSLYLSGSLVLTCAFNGISAPQAQAIGFTFTKIADTNTPIPSGVGNFTSFNQPSIDDGIVGFSTNRGIYSNTGGSLEVLFDTNTSIPTATRNFALLGASSFADGNVAFVGSSNRSRRGFTSGIYSDIGGSLKALVSTNTPIPGRTGNFKGFGGARRSSTSLVSLDNGNVAFLGLGSGNSQGIYSNIGNSLEVVADRNTDIPSGVGTFNQFNQLVLNEGDVAFSGSGRNRQTGIYINTEDGLEVVADSSTSIHDATKTFTRFGGLDLDNGNVAFYGSGRSQRGVYTNLGGNLSAIADLNTLLPGGTGKFIGFDASSPTIDNGVAAFVGFGRKGQAGIFGTFDGSLGKVIGAGDLLDGKEAIAFSLSNEGLDGNSLAFKVKFDDGSSGIYRADAEIPTPALLPGIVGFGVAAWRKRKQAA